MNAPSLGGRLPLPAGEDARVAAALERLGAGAAIRLGPGHDCAAVEVDGSVVVVTSDVLVDGVHFDLERHGPRAVGRKALLANLSDLAAAAAVPVAFEVGVVLPRGAGEELLLGLAEGMAEVAARHGCPCAGGDTNVADAPLVLAITALGRPGPMGVLTRRGARPGDLLSVTGALGGSRAGRHMDPVPRLDEAQALARARIPHAMMDLSDGLSRDLPRLCRASGVGARIDAGDVPVHDDARAAPDGRSPLEHALDDGEDYELLVAHPPLSEAAAAALAEEGVRLLPVGRVLPPEEGIRLHLGGEALPLVPRGWDAFEAPDHEAAPS